MEPIKQPIKDRVKLFQKISFVGLSLKGSLEP